jgi:hypothetical protein
MGIEFKFEYTSFNNSSLITLSKYSRISREDRKQLLIGGCVPVKLWDFVSPNEIVELKKGPAECNITF